MGRAASEAFAALDSLLEVERSALLSGDVDSVSSLSERKNALLDELSTFDPALSAEALELAQSKLTRNQTLLKHAADGIRSVSRRLAAVKRIRHSLDLYRENGERSTIDVGVERSVEKRA